MTEDVHGRAERLIAEARVEGIAATDREWLSGHLEACARCTSLSASTENALRSLRTLPIHLSPTLADRARLRVSLRAGELRQERARAWALWISCALSWVLGVGSAPLVWRACEWLGQEARLPDIVWQAGFALWWLAPVAAVGAFMAANKRRVMRMNEGRMNDEVP